MTDRAPQVAAYLVERQDLASDAQGLLADIARRWPGLTVEETIRSMRIAEEILAGTIVERMASLGAMKVPQVDRTEQGTRMAVAVTPFDESELQKIAEGAGIPVDAVREVIRALQGGEPMLPPGEGPKEG